VAHSELVAVASTVDDAVDDAECVAAEVVELLLLGLEENELDAVTVDERD
jgi:hypothetical protein